MPSPPLLKGPAGHDLEHFYSRAVVGETDGRRPVARPDIAPWSAIARLEIGSVWTDNIVGTAFFIARQVLLTAAHCIEDARIGGKAEMIRITAQSTTGLAVLEVSNESRFHTPSHWMGGAGERSYDYGLIDLRGTSMWATAGHEIDPDVEIDGLLANIAGFPVDRDGGTIMYHHAAAITFASGLELHYHTDTAAGQSGSPIWCYKTASSDVPVLAGIHVAAGASDPHLTGRVTHNVGIPITHKLTDFIQNALEGRI